MTDGGSICPRISRRWSVSSATSFSRQGERDSRHFYLNDVMDLRQLRQIQLRAVQSEFVYLTPG
jgi:hypothetical protein